MLDPKCIYRKSIFAKCTRLACLLSFVSLLILAFYCLFGFQTCKHFSQHSLQCTVQLKHINPPHWWYPGKITVVYFVLLMHAFQPLNSNEMLKNYEKVGWAQARKMKASSQKRKRGRGWRRWTRPSDRGEGDGGCERKRRGKIRERRSVCEGWPVWQRNADRPLSVSLHSVSELLFYACPTLSLSLSSVNTLSSTVSPKLYHWAALRSVSVQRSIRGFSDNVETLLTQTKQLVLPLCSHFDFWRDEVIKFPTVNNFGIFFSTSSPLALKALNCTTAQNVRSRCEDIFMWPVNIFIPLVNIFIWPVNMQKICGSNPSMCELSISERETHHFTLVYAVECNNKCKVYQITHQHGGLLVHNLSLQEGVRSYSWIELVGLI